MKHNQNNRRQRSRGNGRRYPNQKGGSFESNGPEAKVRGTAQQVLEKYQALARDAFSAGDRILAEGYLQHAEHYYRIINSENEMAGRDGNRGRQQRGNRDDGYGDDGYDGDGDGDEREDAVADSNGGNNSNNGNGSRRRQARNDDSAGTEDAGADAAETASADAEGEPEAQPKKPRGRRPRRTEQPSADAQEQAPAGD